jgi:3-deoxy-manno-octulosonate cytidylyltransferase (CMP-KDO synthetase)
MQVTAVIPARYGSTRLPGKPLLEINGKPLIQHVYERTAASSVDNVIVATDDERIVAAVGAFGGSVAMTSLHHRSGTERVAEVAEGLQSDIIVNVQGDEPLIRPEDINAAVAPFKDDSTLPVTTLVTPLLRGTDLVNPNVVKAVIDSRGFALYFSRAPVPFPRSVTEALGTSQYDLGAVLRGLDTERLDGYWQHIGLYAFQKNWLLKFVQLPPSFLEQRERLEQLRILENGFRIKTIAVTAPSIGVDTLEDLEHLRQLL